MFRSLVNIDLGTGAAGTGIAHGPEVVFFVHANDPLFRQADLITPDGESFIVILEHSNPQLVDRQFHLNRKKLPGVADGVFLEIVTKGEVAEHFEKGVVASGAADILQVVMFAAGSNALLCRGGAHVVTPFAAEKDILELVHSGVDEQQGRIVMGDQRRGSDQGVVALLKIAQKAAADFIGCEHERSLLPFLMVSQKVQPTALQCFFRTST